MKKFLAICLSLAMVMGLLTGCGQSSSSSSSSSDSGSDDLPVIRVATLAQQLSLPMYYISEQGWDVENGFKLEITTFSQGTGINEALGSNLVDVATIGAAAVSSCSIYDAMYILSHEDSGAGQQCMVRSDSDIAQVSGYVADRPDLLGSPETLMGAEILLPMGTGSQMLVNTYLSYFGLTESDVTLINMDNAAAYQAFVSGEGDMCLTCYPTADSFTADQYSVAFSMNSCSVPYYDNVIASRNFYDSEDGQDLLVALTVQLMRCAEEFKDDEIIMASMMDWYEVNAQEVDEESIAHQVLERPFFTYDDFMASDTSSSFKQTTEFYASIGNISDDEMTTVFNNIDTEILSLALTAYESQYLT